MPQAPIPFGNFQESGDSQLAGASPVAINVLVDGKGAVRRRPGIAAYSGAPSTVVSSTGITGLHVTEGDELFAVAGNRHIYRIKNGSAYDLSPQEYSELLLGSKRPVFAENEVALVVAGGSQMQKVVFSTLLSTRLSASSTDAPPPASHVIANASRILANDLTSDSTRGRVRYSKTGQTDYDEWPARYMVTAEAKTDPVVALAESINTVWAFGTRTTQLFSPDPSSVYAPTVTLPFGCDAPYSIVGIDDAKAWLASGRRIVMCDGRAEEEISGPIAGTLDSIETIDDCFGYRVQGDQFDCLVWTFPTDRRTFCYQFGGGWSQWHGWDGGLTLFPVTAHAQRVSDNTEIVALSTGRIAQLDPSARDDLGDPIHAEVTTGFLNRGTDARKDCQAAYFVLRRGESSSETSEETALLYWRDDMGPYYDPIEIGLGTSGDREITVELRSLGVYRRRQWRLVFSGTVEWVLVSATEEFTVEGDE